MAIRGSANLIAHAPTRSPALLNPLCAADIPGAVSLRQQKSSRATHLRRGTRAARWEQQPAELSRLFSCPWTLTEEGGSRSANEGSNVVRRRRRAQPGVTAKAAMKLPGRPRILLQKEKSGVGRSRPSPSRAGRFTVFAQRIGGDMITGLFRPVSADWRPAVPTLNERIL